MLITTTRNSCLSRVYVWGWGGGPQVGRGGEGRESGRQQLGRRTQDRKLGSRSGPVTWGVPLQDFGHQVINRTTEGRLAGKQQTARFSDVMFSQNDSVACPWAMNGELCAVASEPPVSLPSRLAQHLSFCYLLPPCPREPWLQHSCSASHCDPSPGHIPMLLLSCPISTLGEDLSSRQTWVLLLPLNPLG